MTTTTATTATATATAFARVNTEWVKTHVLAREGITWGISPSGDCFTVVGETQGGRIVAARTYLPEASRNFRFAGSVFQLGWEYSRPGQDALIAAITAFVASFEDAEWYVGLWLGEESPERRFFNELTDGLIIREYCPADGWKFVSAPVSAQALIDA